MNTELPVPEGYKEPLIPPPIPDPNTPLAIPVALDSKTAANLKLAFAAEARSNDRYHYFATVAEKYEDANATACFKQIAEDKHMFAQGHLKEAIKGGLGDPDTGKPSMSLTQVLETAIVSEMQKRGKEAFLPPLVPFGSKQWPALVTPGPGAKTLDDLK